MEASVPSRAMANQLTGPQGRYSALNPQHFVSYVTFQYQRVAHGRRMCKSNHWDSGREESLPGTSRYYVK